jgi:hypothetical protein
MRQHLEMISKLGRLSRTLSVVSVLSRSKTAGRFSFTAAAITPGDVARRAIIPSLEAISPLKI